MYNFSEKGFSSKKMKKDTDIIIAIGTPHGSGAVGMVRLSGEGSRALALRRLSCNALPHAKMIPCIFSGKVSDRILAVGYDEGKSYTGEESVELYFHGGVTLLDLAVQTLIDDSARQAEGGEFTRRAFLHGKIDLTQAEGITDLIEGTDAQALNAAFEQAEGRTRRAVEQLYSMAVELYARAEVSIDYPEEDVEELTRSELCDGIKKLQEALQKEIDGYSASRLVREGARVVLTGAVNAGKSTLFNTLLGTNRAIVSSEEGTTRDTIEEKLRYRDRTFVLIDTAGLRKTAGDAEQQGIERSKQEANAADLVVEVHWAESENGPTKKAEPKKSFKETETTKNTKNKITVINWTKTPPKENSDTVLHLNAATGEGTDALLESIYTHIKDKTRGGGNINNARQYTAVTDARAALDNAQNALKERTLDCVCADLQDAVRALGKILGKNPTEDVIDEIFSRFCVGK